MAGYALVLQTIAALVLVMGVGYAARRFGLLSSEGVASLGRLVADVCFPALCLEGLARTDGRALASAWPIPLLAFGTLALGFGIGAAVARVAGAGEPRTVRFCVAVGNWIFFPLPLAGALFGASGTLVVLLHNVGAQIFLWSFGIVLLRGRTSPRDTVRALAGNAGLWATLLGVLLALVPVRLGAAPAAAVVGTLAKALGFVGSVTVSLATIVLGAQLADTRGRAASGRAVAWVVAGRLLIVPVLTVVGLRLLGRVVGLDAPALRTEELIAWMPASLTTAALVQRYGGDVPLASRAIAYSTIASVVTVPVALAVTAP